MKIAIAPKTGGFAENKEHASSLRKQIHRALKSGSDVTLDFNGVSYATQSYVHALIAEIIRDEELNALDHLDFKDCSPAVQSIIEIVVSYSQDDWAEQPA